MILLNTYSKLSSIGQTMVNISHQWKEPINHIYYAINSIEAAKEFDDANLSNIIDTSLREIKKTTNYMANTGRNFLYLYEERNEIQNVSIRACVEFSLTILQKDLTQESVKILLNADSKHQLLTDKYLLSNVFVILFENSIKAFKQNATQNL